MKKMKHFFSLLLAVCMLCGTVVQAEDIDSPTGEEELYERMWEAYRNGDQMETWVVDAREKIASELGLSEYLDDRAFLSINYLNETQLGRDGEPIDEKLDLLIEIATNEEVEMIEIAGQIMTLASSSFYEGEYVGVTQQARVSGAGNGYFTIPNASSYGYCAQNKHDFWSNGGVQYGYAYEWDDAIVRKALYYGPGGPGYYGPYYGSTGADMDYVTFTVGYQNGETNNNTKAKNYISFLSGLSDPLSSGYKAYKVDVSPDNYQDVAVLGYVYVPPSTAAPLKIWKLSNTAYDYGNISNTRKYLTGAVFDIYACDGTGYNTYYTRKVGTATDNGDGTYTFNNVTLDSNYGYYCVRERTAPTGYQNKYRMWSSQDASYYNNSTFGGRVFSYDSSTQSWSCLNTSDCTYTTDGFYFADYANEVTVTVNKRDSDTGEKLKGAEFELWSMYFTDSYGSYTEAKIGSFTDNQDGTYSITIPFDMSRLGWRGHNYRIKEVKAPDGYKISSEPLAIWFDQYGNGSTEFNIGNEPACTLQIQKSSANPELTDGNDCYSLKDAEYTIYADSGCTNSVLTLKTDENGNTPLTAIAEGTYWVKETAAPKGYALDTQTYTVTVSGAVTTLNVVDCPQLDPVGILLGKIDRETNQNKPEGSATLQGAHFTIKYYGGLYDEDPAELGQTAKRTWVFETDEDGYCEYRPGDLISGDELFYASNGDPALPVGTITIQETKAPEGYLINPEVFIRKITTEGSAEWVETYNQPIIPEAILKLDLLKKQEGTNIVIPGAKFEHTNPDGTTEILTTDENGKLSFKGLKYGTHKIREISVMDGYLINENVITFHVAEDNTITRTSEFDTTLGNVEFEVTSSGNIEVTVYDKLAPYSILVHKKNENGTNLPGAEFVLYLDAACTNEFLRVTTGEDGIATFSGLTVGTKYYLKEEKAPAGYRIPVDENGNPYITEIYASSIPVQNEFKFYVDQIEYDSSAVGSITLTGTKADREVNIEVVNQTGNKLPHTGSSMTVIMLLFGIVLFCAGMCISGKKKNNSRRTRI